MGLALTHVSPLTFSPSVEFDVSRQRLGLRALPRRFQACRNGTS